jgi:hypothetical protein
MHTAIQIILGIVVAIFIYLLSLWILRKNQLVSQATSTKTSKQNVLILDGYAESTVVAGTQWSTVNPNSQNYVMLDRSYNRKGGAQFSYSIWVQIRDTSAIRGQTLFMRGDPSLYYWTKTVGNNGPVVMNDVLIKCPRVRFGSRFDEGLVVEFNTLQDPQGGSIAIRPNPEPIPVAGQPKASLTTFDETMRHNLYDLIRDRWALLTFTFEDGVAINEFENGIMARFYLNDVLYTSQSVQGALRQNVGDIYLLPAIQNDPNYGNASQQGYTPGQGPDAIPNTTVGNFAYFNYALRLAQVKHLFNKGPPKNPATFGVGPVGEALYLSEYNKLDVYNT